MSLKTAKQLLRKQIKERIKMLTSEEKQRQSAFVSSKLLGLKEFQSAQTIALFLSMDDEINTDKILTQVLSSSNKKCYIPRYYMGSNRMDMVRLYDMEDYDKLSVTKWNIKQPAEDEEREEALDAEEGLDLILIPGLAFTQGGARCGRGRGYYDTYLEKVQKKQKTSPTTVALAFKEQILEEVPTDDHDVRIDMVLFSKS